MPRRTGPTASSNTDHNAWLRVSKGNPCCRKCLPAREALLAFRDLGHPRSKATAAAEKQLSRRVVAAIRKCRSGGSKCERPGRGGRRNIFDVSKERMLARGKCPIPKWQLTPCGIYNKITSPDWKPILFTGVLSVFAGASVYLKNGEPDVDTSRELEDPGSWLQVTQQIKATEMFRFGSLSAARDSVSSAVGLGLKIFKCLIPPSFQPIDGGASEVFFGQGYSGTHTDGRHGILKVLYGEKVVKVLPFENVTKFPQLPVAKTVGRAQVHSYCPFDTQSKLWTTYRLLPGDSLFIPQGMWHAVHSPVKWTVGMAIDIERK
jgi:hypothetical protein